MSALTPDEREAICVCAELSHLLAHDMVKAACEARESEVEAVVAAHVTRALSTAADEIEDLALALVGDPSNPTGHALTAAVLDRASRVVRSHIPT